MIRVCFSCFTTFHLFSSLYYCMNVEWGEDCEKTLIWVNDTHSNVNIDVFSSYFNRVINLNSLRDLSFFKKQIAKCKYGGRMFNSSDIGEYLKIEFEKNILICFSDQHYVTNKLINKFHKLNNNDIVLIEEGVSTYLLDEVFKPKFSTKIANLMFGLHSQRYIGENPFISTLIVKKPSELPNQKVLGRKLVKQNNIFCDFTWVNKLSSIYLPDSLNYSEGKPVLLWIGQPLEGNYIDSDKESSVLSDIFGTLSKKYKILVKMHPNERANRYAQFNSIVEVVDCGDYSWFPIEIIVRKINPDIIATPMSAAAYNIYQSGYSGKILYFYKLFDIDIGKEYFSELETKNNIYIVSNYDEINIMLNSEVKSNSNLSVQESRDIEFFQSLIN